MMQTDAIPRRMKAVIQHGYGTADTVLAVEECDVPAVGADDVLVRVRAASVHADVWHVIVGRPYLLRLMGSGLRTPTQPIPGTDLAGEVVAKGSKVTRFTAGEAVFGLSAPFGWVNGGAYAEYASVPQHLLVAKPTGISFEQAAAVPASGFIALGNIRMADSLGTGRPVLINGAGGAVGTIALQVFKSRGLHVTAVDRGEKLDMLRALGADRVVDFTREDVTRGHERYDFILDVASTLSLRACHRILTPAGLYWLIGHDHFGAATGPVLGSLPRMFGLLARSAFDRHVPRPRFKMPSPQDTADAMSTLKDLLASGTLTPVIGRTFALHEVPEAIGCLQDSRLSGRLLVTPQAAD